jgi:hypothetical protein
MKRNFLKFVAIAGVLLGGSLAASAAESLRMNVPFSFVLAGLEFQPGQYILEENNNGILTVQGEGRGALVTTIPAELSRSNGATSVRFVTDGHEHHLVGLQIEGETSRAVSSPAYREYKLSMGSR